MKLLYRASQYALLKHKGQYRRDNITPYINHPMSVADMVKTEEQKTVAILHDVIEDCNVTKEDLIREGFPENIIEAVCDVTHNKEEPYPDYINRVLESKQNHLTIPVKIADMVCNLSDDPTDNQKKKYYEALIQMSNYEY